MSTETFYWNYGGTFVQFACSQTGWDPTPMTHDDGVWYFGVELESGMCEYKFIVDGEWCYDMLKETVDDNFGGKNNIINIEHLLNIQTSKNVEENIGSCPHDPEIVHYPFNAHSDIHETIGWNHGRNKLHGFPSSSDIHEMINRAHGKNKWSGFPVSDVGISSFPEHRTGTQTFYNRSGVGTTIHWS